MAKSAAIFRAAATNMVQDSAMKIWVRSGSNNDSDAFFRALKWLSVPPDYNKLRALEALSRQRSRVRVSSSPPAFS